MRAVTRVNVEQAPKTAMWKPTRHNNEEGRSRRGSERDTHPTIPPGSGGGTHGKWVMCNKGSPQPWRGRQV